MTATLPTADLTAALEFVQESAAALATAVMDAKEALAVSPSGFAVGQIITPEQVPALPVGAKFRDRDSDPWKVKADGVHFRSYGEVDANYGDYAPLTITHLPDATPAEEPAAPATFQKGDRVKIIGLSLWGIDRKGKLATVTQAYSSPGQVIVTVDGENGFTPGYKAANVEKVTEPVAPSVNVGDRVKVVRVKEGICAYGHEGTVTRTEGGLPGVTFDDGGYVVAAEVKPAAEPTPAPEPKVGDRVRIVGQSRYGSDFIGQTGTVVHNDYNNTPYGCVLVEVAGGGAPATKFFPLKSVEVIEPAAEEAPEPASQLPLELPAKYDDRKVRVSAGFGDVQITVSETMYGKASIFAYLTPEMAETLAASLLAAAKSLR